MEKALRKIEKIIPKSIYKSLQPIYHYLLARTGTIIYGNPSKHIYVIGVTGTKGKSSTAEFVNAILESAGYKTAILSTVRFKIGDKNTPNKYKMTMPGRFFTQRFLSDAVEAKCKYAIIEMTSEGSRFSRHIGVMMDALIFTNLSPEHIESHGSFANYRNAKLNLVKHLAKSKKENKIAVANVDDKYGADFLVYDVDKNIPYSLGDAKIIESNERESKIIYKDTEIDLPLPGHFNILNALAALTFSTEIGIPILIAKKGIENLSMIRGRVQRVETGQDFTVIVDYAHTDDSLRKLYETFKSSRKIGVLGSTGGGRDSWKRPVMGKVADEHCDEIILTNEDPYDEEPMKIINEVANGIKKHTPQIILDRREAIRKAISIARKGDVVLITGKGTDPYIMGPNGTKEVWDDAAVAKEELLLLK